MWVHVSGVPHTVRHFLGLWAVGTLIGKAMDVDLLALRCHNVVRVLVVVRDPKKIDDFNVNSDAFIMLKGYNFRFTKETSDYVPEPDFVPFLWRRHEKDDDAKGPEDKNHDDAAAQDPPRAADGDTQMPQAPDTTAPRAASLGLVGSLDALRGIAVTPINPNPQTPRGKEIVARWRASSSPLFRAGSVGSLSPDGAGLLSSPTDRVELVAPLAIDGGECSAAVVEVARSEPAAAVGWSPAGGTAAQLLHSPAGDAAGLLLQPSVPAVAAQPVSAGRVGLALSDDMLVPLSDAEEVEQLPSSTTVAAPPSSPMPLRSTTLRRSARHAVALDGSTSTDEDALAKAMRRKAELFSDNAGKNNSSKSFLGFLNSNISSKLNKVGISLGKNDSNIVVSH